MTLGSSLVLLSVKHIQQRNMGECLVACAAMVLSYLERSIDYARLMEVLGVRPEIGAPFSRIQALDTLNITVVRGHGTLEQLYNLLANGWPVIAAVRTGELHYWRNIDTGHVVVVVGMDVYHIYLNDPAFTSAPIRVSRGDFDLAWLERDEHYALCGVSTVASA